MSIANALTQEAKNIVKVYDKDFDNSLNYEIKLTKDFSCQSYVVIVDDVFFCDGYATFYFTLPCMVTGPYVLYIIDSTSTTIIYTLSAIVY
jgi:hypothetical protein